MTPRRPVSEHRFIRALLRQPVDTTPVWLMRQAGRYLPEYRAVRERAGDFLSLCQNPQLACEVTVQPLRRFDLDAAIVFSDILTIPHAMGLGLSLVEGEGPRFAHPLRDAAAIDALHVPDPERELGYVMETLALVREALAERVPLIGFSGSPWTLAAYMVEGGSSREFLNARSLLYRDPAAAHRLLGTLAEAVGRYLAAQVRAGAQVVMVFDTWGGLLDDARYAEFSHPYIARALEAVPRSHDGETVPRIVFTRGGGARLARLATDSGCDALGIDWTVPLGATADALGGQVALQGNLDPAVLLADAASVERETVATLEAFGRRPGHVFNLGHGVTPGTPPEHVAVLVDTVHRHAAALHE